ncbi:PREDICTED: basic proline-rich protein-like [Chinchilla lanigera]|uniref:basic proline-rich protein-like n=1 Tax=Chinchilla lanigera TaxID=34839 RepID=UPI00038F15DD|nr:PREDICTED: basic proline-rich protein-like [Chinchilla lanigera]
MAPGLLLPARPLRFYGFVEGARHLLLHRPRRTRGSASPEASQPSLLGAPHPPGPDSRGARSCVRPPCTPARRRVCPSPLLPSRPLSAPLSPQSPCHSPQRHRAGQRPGAATPSASGWARDLAVTAIGFLCPPRRLPVPPPSFPSSKGRLGTACRDPLLCTPGRAPRLGLCPRCRLAALSGIRPRCPAAFPAPPSPPPSAHCPQRLSSVLLRRPRPTHTSARPEPAALPPRGARPHGVAGRPPRLPPAHCDVPSRRAARGARLQCARTRPVPVPAPAAPWGPWSELLTLGPGSFPGSRMLLPLPALSSSSSFIPRPCLALRPLPPGSLPGSSSKPIRPHTAASGSLRRAGKPHLCDRNVLSRPPLLLVSRDDVKVAAAVWKLGAWRKRQSWRVTPPV